METTHFSHRPSVLVRAMLTSYSTLLKQAGGRRRGGSGVLSTVGRVASTDPEDIKAGLSPGIPGLLVLYAGGTYSVRGTGRQKYHHTMNLSVLCCAGKTTNVADRLAEGEQDPDLGFEPGVEELQDWAFYLGLRALRGEGVNMPTATRSSQVFRIESHCYIGSVDLTAQREVDVYDDSLANSLLRLGIVHSPLDPDDLWEPDNTTPRSEWPPTTDGGVTDL